MSETPGTIAQSQVFYQDSATTLAPVTSTTPLPIVIEAGTSSIGNVDIFGNTGATLDALPGSASTNALCVQGIAGGTSIPVTDTTNAAAFKPNGNYATITASNVSSNVALPAGSVIVVFNISGGTTAYVNLGTSNAVTATTTNIPVAAGGFQTFTVGTNTFIAAITSSSTATLVIAGGSGNSGSSSGTAPLNTIANNITQIAGSAISTAASGTAKVGIVGNAAATLDATLAAGTAPTNGIAIIGTYNSGGVAPSNTQSVGLQVGAKGSLKCELWGQGQLNGVGSNAPADTFSAPTGALEVLTFEELYNGSTYDRKRSISATFGSATGVQAVEEAGASFGHMSTNTTTTHKSGAGILHKIIINTKGASANTATVYDNTAASGTVIATIDTTAATGTLTYDLSFATGLTIITATGTAPDLTVVYR